MNSDELTHSLNTLHRTRWRMDVRYIRELNGTFSEGTGDDDRLSGGFSYVSDSLPAYLL